MLTPLQERVARIVTSLPQAEGFALAGGAALVVTRMVDRSTKDLDFFGASGEDVHRLLEALDAALTGEALAVRRERVGSSFARLTVTAADGDATEVDLAADARIRPAEPGPFGPVLSMEELAADKLLALFDRAEARDFVDVSALAGRFGFDRLCELAKEKDAGFSPTELHHMLGRFSRFDRDEFGLNDAGYEQLAQQVNQWRGLLQRSINPPHEGLGL